MVITAIEDTANVRCKVCIPSSVKTLVCGPERIHTSHASPETYSFMLFWDSTTVEMIMVIRARAIQSQPRSVTWNFSPSTM